MALNTRQKRFVEHYGATGNATQAARLAGYSSKTARQIGQRVLTNVDVARAIQEHEKERRSAAIADRQERLSFLTSVMRDERREDVYRLRAADQLSKASGDYVHVQPVELSGPGGDCVRVAEGPEPDYTNLTFDEMRLLEALAAKIYEGDFAPMKELKRGWPWMAPLRTMTEEEAAKEHEGHEEYTQRLDRRRAREVKEICG